MIYRTFKPSKFWSLNHRSAICLVKEDRYSDCRLPSVSRGIAGEVLKKQGKGIVNDGQSKSSASGQRQSSNEEEEEAESSRKAMKYTLAFFGVSLSGLAGYVIGVWGAPKRDEDGNMLKDKFSSKPLPLQYVARAWSAMMNYSKVIISMINKETASEFHKVYYFFLDDKRSFKG